MLEESQKDPNDGLYEEVSEASESDWEEDHDVKELEYLPAKGLPNKKMLKKIMKNKAKNNSHSNSALYGELRYMKNSDQIQILEHEYAKDPYWSKEKMKKLAQQLNLKES